MTEENRIFNVNITFKNTESTEAIKQYTSEKIITCLKKFVRGNTDAHVVLKVEKNRQIAEVSLHADGADFKVKEESPDLYASIDALINSLAMQLRRHKDKITEHH